MIALVEFDEVLTQDQYDKLSNLYDFGEISFRIYKDYDNKLRKLSEGMYFYDEVSEQIIDNKIHYFLKSNMDKEIPDYCLKKEYVGNYVAITKTQHVVDLEELYKTCRKVQVKILEVAKI